MKKVSFTEMKNGTKEDYQLLEKYDQASFDPNYKSMTLDEFYPMVQNIFSKKPYYYL